MDQKEKDAKYDLYGSLGGLLGLLYATYYEEGMVRVFLRLFAGLGVGGFLAYVHITSLGGYSEDLLGRY